jgi:hypothetical protein
MNQEASDIVAELYAPTVDKNVMLGLGLCRSSNGKLELQTSLVTCTANSRLRANRHRWPTPSVATISLLVSQAAARLPSAIAASGSPPEPTSLYTENTWFDSTGLLIRVGGWLVMGRPVVRVGWETQTETNRIFGHLATIPHEGAASLVSMLAALGVIELRAASGDMRRLFAAHPHPRRLENELVPFVRLTNDDAPTEAAPAQPAM